MNLHITIPDERAKDLEAACVARGESWQDFAERAVLAALRVPAKAEPKAIETKPEPAEAVKAEPKDKKG